VPFDTKQYARRSQEGPCFVCAILAGERPHHSEVVPTERTYSLSLGSKQGNAHLHWHVAPLPPGVPYERQQYHALVTENGVLDVDESSQAALARDIRSLLSDR
jgi:hypothetical protein